MIFSAIYGEIQNWTGERDAIKAKQAFNSIYRHVCNTIKLPQLSIPGTLPLVAGTQAYTGLPLDFRWMRKVFYRGTGGGEPYPIHMVNRILPNSGTNGTPRWYRISKNSSKVWQIEFYPIPNASFVTTFSPVKFEYWYQVSDLSGDTDEPKLDPGDVQTLIWGGCMILLAKQTDSESFVMFKTLYEDAIGELQDKAIQLTGPPVIGPGDEVIEAEIDEASVQDYGHIIDI